MEGGGVGTQGAYAHAECPNHPRPQTAAAAPDARVGCVGCVGCRLLNAELVSVYGARA